MKLIKLFIGLLLVFGWSCKDKVQNAPVFEHPSVLNEAPIADSLLNITKDVETIQVNKDVPIRDYFKWMDSVVAAHNQTRNYQINEYILVHHNAWIMDTLAHTDYYYLQEKGVFNEDSQALLVLVKDQALTVPDSLETEQIKDRLANTYLDLNIPEFKLRIIENGQALYHFPMRVGQNGKRYMAMAKRDVDMRTKPGVGTIIRVNKNPAFINPKDNKRYHSTRRDDGKVTKLPAIPWIEPAINGISHGQLIHPTTNLETLEKAYSNGCIGLREADAWMVYYYAPLGTKILIRYDLTGKDEDGQTVEFKNIYPGFEKLSIQKEAIEAALKDIDGKDMSVCYCHME